MSLDCRRKASIQSDLIECSSLRGRVPDLFTGASSLCPNTGKQERDAMVFLRLSVQFPGRGLR